MLSLLPLLRALSGFGLRRFPGRTLLCFPGRLLRGVPGFDLLGFPRGFLDALVCLNFCNFLGWPLRGLLDRFLCRWFRSFLRNDRWTLLRSFRRSRFMPAVSVTYGNHRSQNVVPGVLLHHDFVWEHAAIPANVAKGFGKAPVFPVQPIASVMRDRQLAVRIIRQTMMAGFVVGA